MENTVQIKRIVGGPLDVNTYFVRMDGNDHGILIDPGAEYEAVKQYVGDCNVDAVLLTHSHFDHFFHIMPWIEAGAKVYIHEADAPNLSDPEHNLSQYCGFNVSIPQANVLLKDGDTVKEAGMEFQVIHTPGHSEGGVCYVLGQYLFSGDTMFYGTCGRTDLYGGDAGKIVKSLKKLYQLDDGINVLPGHGNATKIEWERGVSYDFFG